MKQKIYSLFSLPFAITCMMLICLPQLKLMAAHNRQNVLINGFDGDKKSGKKERSFKNQDAVKVFPDVLRKAMHVVARSGNQKEIDFLVFDVNGNMVLDYKMKAGERRTIRNLKKGAYMYHVFAEDEYLTTGKIEFK